MVDFSFVLTLTWSRASWRNFGTLSSWSSWLLNNFRFSFNQNLFFQRSLRAGRDAEWPSKGNLCGLLKCGFYRPDGPPVAGPTVSKHWGSMLSSKRLYSCPPHLSFVTTLPENYEAVRGMCSVEACRLYLTVTEFISPSAKTSLVPTVAWKFFQQLVCTVSVCGLAVWCNGNALVSINAVALHRARLVLGWVTAFGEVNCLIT